MPETGGWTYHTELIPRFNPPYAGQYACAQVDTSHPQWQADAWYLERKHPERWALRHRLEHSGPDGGPIDVRNTGYDLSMLTEAELETFLALARKASPSPGRQRP